MEQLTESSRKQMSFKSGLFNRAGSSEFQARGAVLLNDLLARKKE